MADTPTDTGMNRTGIATSPFDATKTIQGARDAHTLTVPPVDGEALMGERVLWARDADPVGSVPPPATVKGFVKTLIERVQGHKPTVMIDKLGQRLAYERTGVRLYEALLAKYDAAEIHVGGPTRMELLEIRNDEHEHMLIVREAIRQLGADPTAMTPGADVMGVASLGWVQVLGDPRTTFSQCLDVMQAVEDGDVDGWLLLIDMAQALGLDELETKFRQAELTETEHAQKIRLWLRASIMGQLGTHDTPERPRVA